MKRSIPSFVNAASYVEQHRSSHIVGYRIRRKYIVEWVAAKMDGLSDEDANREALKWAKRNSGNPLLWFAISFIIQNIVLPLLKKWWEERNT